MRLSKRVAGAAGAIVALGLGLAAARADDAAIVAVVDQARLVKVPAGAETLIIGNPTIADVTLLKQNGIMVLTPRAYGETNFIALDGRGNPVAQSVIRVVNGADAIIVQRGMSRESYSCAPRCQPTERLGDDDGYLNKVSAQVQAHTVRLSAQPAPTGPGLMSPAH